MVPLIERVEFAKEIPLISFYGEQDWMDRQGGAYMGDIGRESFLGKQ